MAQGVPGAADGPAPALGAGFVTSTPPYVGADTTKPEPSGVRSPKSGAECDNRETEPLVNPSHHIDVEPAHRCRTDASPKRGPGQSRVDLEIRIEAAI